jgi:hypothetical protein
MLLYCDFTVFASWIDREYKIIREKKQFYTIKILTELPTDLIPQRIGIKL